MQILYWHVTKPRPSSTSATITGVSLSSPPLLTRHAHLMESSSTSSYLLLPSSPTNDELILGLPLEDEVDEPLRPPSPLPPPPPPPPPSNSSSSKRKDTRVPQDDPSGSHPFILNSKRPKLVINLHESRRGYDIALAPATNTSDDEEEDKSRLLPLTSHTIPYTENDPFLEALNHSSVPTMTYDDKMSSFPSALYGPGGTICAQVRDYRRFKERLKNLGRIARVPQRKNILLKPSAVSLEKDFQNILAQSVADTMLYKADVLVKGKEAWDSECDPQSDDEGDKHKQPVTLSYDQRLELEKEFVNATAGPVCLDPGRGGAVAALENRRQWEGLKWEGTGKKVPKGRRGPCPRVEETSTPIANSPGAKIQGLLAFIQGVKERSGVIKDRDPFKLPQMASLEYPPLEPPKSMEEISKLLARSGGVNGPTGGVRPFPLDNFSKKVEEYVLETERRKRPHTTKLTIYQKNGMDAYYGELEIESFGEPPSPIASVSGKQQQTVNSLPTTKCQFDLGSSRSVALYVKQFTDIFTEDGRRSCKIVYTKHGGPSPQTQVLFVNSYNANGPGANGGVVNGTSNDAGGRNVVVKSQGATAVAATAAAAGSPTVQQTQQPPPTPTTPPVQIVHPQPRSTTISATTATVSAMESQSQASAAPTQVPLTRPLQQQQQPQTQVILQAGQGQTHIVRPTTAAQQQQLLQQRLLRLKQAQLQQQQQQQQQQAALQQTPSSQIPQQQTALAKLLLTNVVSTSQSTQQQQRPITVAVQPQPQKANDNSSPASAASSLNTITLDGLLGSSGQVQSQYVHHIQQQQRQGVNILRGNASSAAAAATTLLQRQLAAGNVSIVQSSGGQRILINSGSAAYATAAAAAATANAAVANQQPTSTTTNDIHHHQELVAHHHPDLATLLQPSSVGGGGTTTYALDTSHHHVHQTPHHNVNLNVNVNVNASSGVVGGGDGVSVGGSSAAAPPPFLVFISPLRSVPVSLAAGGTFHATSQASTQQSVQVTTAQIPSVSTVPQQQQQLTISAPPAQQSSAEPQTVEDTLLSAISDAIGPELSNKIEGLGGGIGGTPNGTTVMIGSTPYTLSLAPSNATASPGGTMASGEVVHQAAVGSKKDGSSITLSDLLGSPGSTGGGGISGELSSSPSPASSSTPRLSALLAGTPSGDGGSLLERLGGGRSSSVSSGGLNPIATATPSVVLEHPVLAATLTGGGGANRGGSGGYRQIAPAPHHHLSHHHTVVVQSTPQQHPQSSSQSQ